MSRNDVSYPSISLSVTGESVWELPDGVVAKKGEDDAGKSTATATGASPDPCTESSPLSAEDSSHHWLGALDEAYSLVEVSQASTLVVLPDSSNPEALTTHKTGCQEGG